MKPGVDRAMAAQGTARHLRTKGLRLLEVVKPQRGWDSPTVYCLLGQDPSAAVWGGQGCTCVGPTRGRIAPGEFQGLTLISEDECGGLGTQTHWAATVSLLPGCVLSFAYGCPGPLTPCPWLSRSPSAPSFLTACTGAVGGDWGLTFLRAAPTDAPQSHACPRLSPLLEDVYRLG